MRLGKHGWLLAVLFAVAVATTVLLAGLSSLSEVGRDLYAAKLIQHVGGSATTGSEPPDEPLLIASCRHLSGASRLNAGELGAAAFDLAGALRREVERQVLRDALEQLSMLEMLRALWSGPDDAAIDRAKRKFEVLQRVTRPARTVSGMILRCGSRTDVDASG